MEAKHTPGPWTVGRMQRSSNFAKDTFAVQGDGTVLCRVKGGVTEDAGIAEANARVMAAAPDLLTNGWWLAVSAMQSERYVRDRDFRDLVDIMLDSCRRARGEPTLAESQAAKAEGSPQ